ncbi:putative NADH dehydrogenase [ubiquinone] iron-sulfur protein 6, mitochondrial [Pseudolycoriella hygida]|uniref:NADH dehydrogenase [ubiquinone] iron-sulfur protein 6, mitochondrial n=1 Tax=Pseudolycoriella hygida TaxID=35572 RepID=A0A9Q0S6X6_9DIPT|nr:putative NADH dehydrogenase [ubiquinone] iron-sulfur protein 6, mitochondrial [Pseudolycoriella hygida]
MASRKFLLNLNNSTIISRNLATGKLCCSSIDSSKKAELSELTHTGQAFDVSDYRNVRFTNATRTVNPNWGIKLISEIPPKECVDRVIYCDGGDGPLGHPKVYINLDKPGAHACGYCGLRFVLKGGHH